MNPFKSVLAIVLCFIFVIIFILPDNRENRLQATVDNIGSYDFKAEVEKSLKKGDWMHAVTLLDVVIDTDEAGKAAAMEHRRLVLNRFLNKKSYIDQLNAYGWLDPGYRGSSWNVLTSKGVAEFFILEKQPPQQKADSPHKELLANLNNLLVLKELWPDAEYAVPAFETAINESVFTATMFKTITRKFSLIKDPKSMSPAAVRQVLDTSVPIWQLLNRCQTWYQFKLLMKNVDDAQQIQYYLNLTATDPANMQKLTQILTMMSYDPAAMVKVLSFLSKYNVDGLNRLYAILYKGPKGIEFVMNHPGFQPELQYAGQQQSTVKSFLSWWQSQLLQSRVMAEIVRHLVLFLIGVGVVALFVPEKSILPSAGILGIFIIIIFAFNMFSVNTELSPSPETTPSPLVASTGGVYQSGGSSMMGGGASSAKTYHFGADSLLALLIIIFLQGLACYRAIGEFKNVRGMRASYEGKLKQIDNVDIFFDLPLYLGLLGTISSFIIMLFNPETSRIVAYTSTIFGLIISASLRVFYLYPFRRELLSNMDFSGKEKL